MAHLQIPNCKVLFLHGELLVVNGNSAEMKAEHMRKFRKFGISRLTEMAFSEFSLARPNTYEKKYIIKNKRIVNLKFRP
jgi:hypothetical protein